MAYIDGLKGILCCLIVIGHYFGMYKNIEGNNIFQTSVLELMRENVVCSILVSASFWLQAYFIISGFLLARTVRIKNLRELLVKVFKRFMRFLFPIAGACLIIFVMYMVFGFQNADTADYFKNDWFQGFYSEPISGLDIFLNPFVTVLFGMSKFNEPYWMISNMFYASICIYVISLYQSRITKIKPWQWGLLLILVKVIDYIWFACILGYVIGHEVVEAEEAKEEKGHGGRVKLVICVVAVVLSCVCVKLQIFPCVFDEKLIAIEAFGVLVYIVHYFDLLKKILGCKFCRFLGVISFGIYSVHWPIVCSIGSMLLINMLKKDVVPIAALGSVWLISMFLTIVVAVLYHYAIEKPLIKLADIIFDKCRKYVNK